MTARSVLVVDDAPNVAASAVHALEAAGLTARSALTAQTALAELAVSPVAAVVLDYHLGAGAAGLRHVLVALRLPVLLVSGLDEDVARGIAAAHGWPFLQKPVEDNALVASVFNLLTASEPAPMPDRPSPDPRPSIVPDLPPAPATIAPREAPLPAPPPAAQLTPSGRPLSAPTVVQVLDRIGDMLGCIILGLLCNAGKIGGTETLIAIGAILGVGTGLRQIGARAGAGAGVGVVGLLVLGVGRWLAPAAGAAELARVSGLFGLLAVLVLGACGPARDALLTAAGAPTVSNCAAGAYRCNGSVPEACSRSGRWWPSLPRDATGRQLACLDGCVVGDGGVAHCAPADGGAR